MGIIYSYRYIYILFALLECRDR